MRFPTSRFRFPVVLSVVVAATVTMCSYALQSQDTTLQGYLSGMMVSVIGGPGDNQLIRVNLHNYQLSLYENGQLYTSTFIAGAGNPYNATRTPTGSFRILSKEKLHVSRLSKGQVLMPLAMRFYEGYYFHDIPLYVNGTRITTRYSWGCVRVPTEFAQTFYDWTRIGATVQIHRADLAKDAVSPTVYYLTEDGFRRPVANLQAFAAHGFTWDRVAVVPTEELDVLPLGEMLY